MNNTGLQDSQLQTLENIPDETAKSTWPSDAEHQMLRTEMLQYMEEYQNIRNMMYVGTVTLFGFNSSIWENVYLFLLPLVIILPSYIIFFNYWQSVSIASLYIQKFLEQDPDGNFTGSYRWETLHNKFLSEMNKNAYRPKIFSHKIPYLVCAILCLSVYWYIIGLGQFQCHKINLTVAKPLGIFAVVCCIIVFVIYRSPDDKAIMDAWKQVEDHL